MANERRREKMLIPLASRESDAGHPSCSATSWWVAGDSERQTGLYFLTYEMGLALSNSAVTPSSTPSAGETPALQVFSSFLGTAADAAFWYYS